MKVTTTNLRVCCSSDVLVVNFDHEGRLLCLHMKRKLHISIGEKKGNPKSRHGRKAMLSPIHVIALDLGVCGA